MVEVFYVLIVVVVIRVCCVYLVKLIELCIKMCIIIKFPES